MNAPTDLAYRYSRPVFGGTAAIYVHESDPDRYALVTSHHVTYYRTVDGFGIAELHETTR